MKNKLLMISLVASIIVGLFLHDTYLGTITMLAGFTNVYLTTKGSKWFIIPDLIWISGMIISLILKGVISDIPLYIFYLIIAFWQYREFNKNSDKNGVKWRNLSDARFALMLSFGIILTLLFIVPNSNFAILGALASGLGIIGSMLLANRYYQAEIIYFFVNSLQVYIYVCSDLVQLSLIPLMFWINTIIFLIYNRVDEK